jgi:hypothetical protein
MLRRGAIVVRMPRLAPVMKSARLVQWFKGSGDSIQPYELLFRIETESLLESEPGETRKLDIECCDPAVLGKILVLPSEREILPDTPLALLYEEDGEFEHVEVEDVCESSRSMVWQAYLAHASDSSSCGCH